MKDEEEIVLKLDTSIQRDSTINGVVNKTSITENLSQQLKEDSTF
jgi:hypothetical protein